MALSGRHEVIIVDVGPRDKPFRAPLPVIRRRLRRRPPPGPGQRPGRHGRPPRTRRPAAGEEVPHRPDRHHLLRTARPQATPVLLRHNDDPASSALEPAPGLARLPELVVASASAGLACRGHHDRRSPTTLLRCGPDRVPDRAGGPHQRHQTRRRLFRTGTSRLPEITRAHHDQQRGAGQPVPLAPRTPRWPQEATRPAPGRGRQRAG